MAAFPEPSAPIPPPALTPTAGPVPVPVPEAGIAPSPAPTPVAEPTPGPLPVAGRGHPVVSVEIIGQPVAESGPIGALHLAEVISYSDGTKPDIVGYDPQGPGFIHGNDRLFAETSLGHATPKEYIAAGKERYHLTIEATPHQSLDEFVAHQEHAWKMYDRSGGVPRYDAAGNDVTFHNSNGAMVASIREAGRGDVANRLQRDLEPPAQMRALERGPDHLSAEAASMRLALERRLEGEPSAPGAFHELTRAQVEGLATPEPTALEKGLPGRQGFGLRDAALSFIEGANRSSGQPPDMFDNAPARDGQYFTLMRTDAQGAQSLQRMREPFQMQGTIISADAERVTQSIGRGQTFTYKTEDLLQAALDREGALRLLDHAAVNHELTSIKLGSRGLDITTQSMEQGRGYEHGR